MYEFLIVKEKVRLQNRAGTSALFLAEGLGMWFSVSHSINPGIVIEVCVCVFIGLLRLKGSAIALGDYNRLYQQDKEFKRAVCP